MARLAALSPFRLAPVAPVVALSALPVALANPVLVARYR
jgi:hypothetical protein